MASTTPTARPYHHGNLRAELLAEAERTVREQGVESLSLRELARAAGVSHGAPRRHFADRQALLDALAEQGFVRLRRELHEALITAGPRFSSRLAATANAYVRFASDDAALLELMFARKHSESTGPLHDASERTFELMLEVIAQGQRENALAAGEPERVGLVLFATLHGIATLINAGVIDRERRDELVVDATARFLRGSRPQQR